MATFANKRGNYFNHKPGKVVENLDVKETNFRAYTSLK